jgi:hypothetical protein
VAAEATPYDLLAHVLWRSTLARVRALEGSTLEATELATEARRLLAEAEFPQVEVGALTAAAEAATAANNSAEAERLLAEARRIAEAKGARATLAQLEGAAAAG